MIETLERVTEVEVSPEKLYKIWKEDIHDIPKHIPHCYKSVDLLEDGVAPVKLWRYVFGGKTIYVKEKTIFDDEKRSVNHVVLDGVIFNEFKSFEAKATISPKIVDGHVNGSLVKWELIYEKKNESVPDPTGYLDFFEQATTDMDRQMLLTEKLPTTTAA